MVDFYSSANGQRLASLSLSVPYFGAPTAEVSLATDAPLVAPVMLTVGNLTLSMGIVRQKPFAGQTQALLVGGAGRWNVDATIGPYENPVGVMLSTVLADLVKATRSTIADASTGERVLLAADRSLGTLYVPEKAPASRILSSLAGELWWIDTAGATHVGPRTTSTIRTDASVEGRKGARGWLEVATEDPASWMPGAQYSGVTVTDTITVASSRFVFGNEGKLRVYVLTSDSLVASDPGAPSPQDRTAAALRAFIRAENVRRTYQGVYEYTVIEADGSTFGGLPVNATVAPPLPKHVPYRPSIAGSTCVPKPGTLALVAFVNGDPARPFVLAFDGTTPTSTSINADAVNLGAAAGTMIRAGDTISIATVPPVAGIITITSGTAQSPPAISKVKG